MNITPSEIKKQYNRIKKAGWLTFFEGAAVRYASKGFTTAHLLAIGSRETNLKNIRGDFRGGKYHGYGVMQVDIGTDAEYAKTWTPEKVEPSIRRGAEILASKVNDTWACVGKRVKVRGKTFTGKAVTNWEARRIATAAYNCGRWAHYHFSRGENVDSTTTGHDYSRDVYDRAIEFARLLQADGAYEAVAKEADLQGMYVRADVAKNFGVASKPEDELSVAEPFGEGGGGNSGADVDIAGASAPTDSGPTVNVEKAETVNATTTPVEGGGVNDPPVQASQGGKKSLLATVVGVITGVGTAVKGWFSGDSFLMAVGIICATTVLLALIFRQTLNDWLRMKLFADPNKINVK